MEDDGFGVEGVEYEGCGVAAGEDEGGGFWGEALPEGADSGCVAFCPGYLEDVVGLAVDGIGV